MPGTRPAFSRGSAGTASNGRAVPVVVGSNRAPAPHGHSDPTTCGKGHSREARSWTALPAQKEAVARMSSVVTDDPATNHMTTLLVRRWDAGCDPASQKAGAPENRSRDRGSGKRIRLRSAPLSEVLSSPFPCVARHLFAAKREPGTPTRGGAFLSWGDPRASRDARHLRWRYCSCRSGAWSRDRFTHRAAAK